jgi:hypothetical protein
MFKYLPYQKNQIEAADIGFYTYALHEFRYGEQFLRKSTGIDSSFM